MGKQEWLLLLLSLLWGGSFFFNEIILRELQPFAPVLGRALSDSSAPAAPGSHSGCRPRLQ